MLEDGSSIVSSAFSIPARAWEGEGRQHQEGLKKRDGEQRKAWLSCKWSWLGWDCKALLECDWIPAVLAGCPMNFHQCCSVDMGGIDLPLLKKERGDCAFGWPWPWFFTKAKVEAHTYLFRQYLCTTASFSLPLYRASEGNKCSWLVTMVRMVSR